MLELRFLRENIDFVKEKTAKRGLSTEKLDEFIIIDNEIRRGIVEFCAFVPQAT